MLNVTRGRRRAPDRIFLVGVEGIGKSTFGANAPNSVFLDLEDGTGRLDVARLDRPRTLADFYARLRDLYTEPHEFKSLVVDTADALDALVIAKVCGENNWRTKDGAPDPEKPGYGKGYVATAEEWRRVLVELDKVRGVGMEIILLAHAKITSFSNPLGPDYNRYTPKLSKGAAELVREWSDTVLFAIHEEFVKATSKGENPRGKAYSSGLRVMKTERSAGWDAKNRDNLPSELPLDYAAFAAAREAGVSAQLPALQAEADALLAQIANHPKAAEARAFVERNREDPQALARALNRLRNLASESTAQEPAHVA